LIISFFIFGVYPIICNKIGLVNNAGTVKSVIIGADSIMTRSKIEAARKKNDDMAAAADPENDVKMTPTLKRRE